nr:hypothetical protein [Candidatus Brachybacter algidus]
MQQINLHLEVAKEKTIFEEVISNTTTRQVLRTVAREAIEDC